jgi:uncharacterized protein YgiM (DUF1202 family)
LKKVYKLALFIFVLILISVACNLPSETLGTVTDSTATPIPDSQTQPAPDDQELTSPNPEPSGTSTHTNTPTPSNTPTITLTATPSTPMVSVSTNTNCRTGPGVVYDLLTTLLVGEEAEVVGKYTTSNPPHWIIKKGGITCWLWGEYATVVGDTNNLPEMVPPPTPTPSPTATPTPSLTPEPVGDLYILEIFMSTQFEVVIRVAANPSGSLSGNFQYTVYADGSQSTQGNCVVPTGSNACYTGHTVSGSQSIQAVIDSNNQIPETNEGNNSTTVTCDKAAFTCN